MVGTLETLASLLPPSRLPQSTLDRDCGMAAGNLLKPMLGRGELRCIGATTLDEYRKHIEKDPALERRFQQVYVDQPSVPDTVSILRGLRERYVFGLVVELGFCLVLFIGWWGGGLLGVFYFFGWSAAVEGACKPYCMLLETLQHKDPAFEANQTFLLLDQQ